MTEKTIQLPWPPSVNHYLKITRKKNKNSKMVASQSKTKAANKYIDAVFFYVKQQNIKSFGSARIKVDIVAMAPDNRKRDLDNLFKMILDSLESAGVYDNDSQIDHLSIKRGEKVKHGRILATISEIIV